MRGARRLGALLLGATFVLGCASTKPALQGAEFHYEKAMEDLRRGRCTEAAEELQRVVSNYPGSAVAPAAQFHLAEAHFCARDFVNAVFEYQRLIDTYPSSEWVDEAQYQIAESYYEQSRRAELDQSETRDALSYYRLYLDDNPQGERAGDARARIAECRGKLARKLLLSARLYHRQGHLEAARMYYTELADTYPDTDSYYPAVLALGDVALALGQRDVALRHWSEVASSSADPDLREQAERKLVEGPPAGTD